MPYNTRRKSLSLPSLGIHVPVSKDSKAAAAAGKASKEQKDSSHTSSHTRSNTAANMTSPTPSNTSSSKAESTCSKKLKRTHSAVETEGRAHPSEPLQKKREERETVRFQNTPPPSPGGARQSVECDDPPRPIDFEAINDDIVEAVIVQLQNTGNRPHLVKELAAVLMQQLKIVQQSANPCAIVSSRLSTFLKRTCWNVSSPCPIAKELESVHPRRTYFYLTTCPHQPLPDPAQAAALNLASRAIISPSISSAASGTDESDLDRRRELSPSPEVDLSSPEFDDMEDDVPMPSTPIGSFSTRYCLSGVHSSNNSQNGRNHRAVSPPLEKDEKEFTQTATGLQKRKLNGELSASSPVNTAMDIDYCPKDDNVLFGERTSYLTSPAMKPSSTMMSLNYGRKEFGGTSESESWRKLDAMLEWDRNPENIELDELDCLLDDF
ncbi:hypothetical protein B0T13DRAFT_148301 [Neurospora crassa]|nr:hypothetical protein B0T13DRAFT_148301 [Neurospora crassa]